MILTPADCVLKEFGGVRPLAKLLGKSPSTVCRWRMAPPDGTGGRIPTSVQQRLLSMARERGLDLTAEDIVSGRTVPTTIISG